LLVFGSGNDGNNIDLDVNSNFPRDSKDNKTEFASNVLSIGALTDVYGENVIAPYSNYGKLNVDVFAPGSEIYASVPNNKYKYLQGTSMASPNAAGVAALIRSYYPKLSAKEVKQILMDSGTLLPVTVALGESQEKKSVAETSKSGKMINAYDALLMAERMSKK
jgi:subtilisin family serine protease